MKKLVAILFFFSINIETVHSAIDSSDPRIKAHRYYKQGFKEYQSKQYVEAVAHIEQAIKIFPRHKRAKEILQELRKIGEDYYNTGIALIYFNKKMSHDFLAQADRLLDPKNHKRKKIAKIIERLERSEQDHSRQQEPTEQEFQDTEQQDS